MGKFRALGARERRLSEDLALLVERGATGENGLLSIGESVVFAVAAGSGRAAIASEAPLALPPCDATPGPVTRAGRSPKAAYRGPGSVDNLNAYTGKDYFRFLACFGNL